FNYVELKSGIPPTSSYSSNYITLPHMDNLKKKISEVYYNHGLFCATHPVQVIVSVCIIVVILCFPLCQLFIMEDVPLEHMILREDEFQTFENSHMLFIATRNVEE
ncbi:unnamed protein product, partial [Dicrocoelium dendriticum]